MSVTGAPPTGDPADVDGRAHASWSAWTYIDSLVRIGQLKLTLFFSILSTDILAGEYGQ
jgi:hypothetical protein